MISRRKFERLPWIFIESLPAEVKQFLDFSGVLGTSASKMGCEVCVNKQRRIWRRIMVWVRFGSGAVPSVGF